MARPLRIEYEGAIYHVISRGNNGNNIYRTDRDKRRFLEYLESTKDQYQFIVHAYCLMDNHYHLLLETPEANLSKGMQMLNSAYTTYHNTVHKKRGHLFQGRYKASLVDKDSYMAEVSRYIHLNPVRAGIINDPSKYIWSSCRAYVSKQKSFVSKEIIYLFINK